METQVNTVTELCAAAADALNSRDVEALECLLRHASDWMQTREESEAQERMLTAMLEAAYALADYETN